MDLTEPQKNWAGNYVFGAVRLHRPTTVEQVQEIVSRSDKVRAVGSRHSFNGIADSTEDLISLENLDRVVTLDRDRHTVTVEGGIRYSQLCPQLHQEGYALRNMAGLPDITVAGACATGTHGSGDRHGNLATAVVALQIVKADGEAVELSRARDGETFQGAVVGLGGLGVVTRLTLELVPTFAMRQDIYASLPQARLEAQFEAIMSSAYSVSLFTDLRGFDQIWLKSRISGGSPAAPEPALFEATRQTEQTGIPGPWYERLPHFQIGQLSSIGTMLQSEYMVSRKDAVEALRVVRGLHEQIAPHLLSCEVRTTAADEFWMSPFYRRDSATIHFNWRIDRPGVRELLPRIEAGLAPFAARPHWGKLFMTPACQMPSLYERLPDFQRLLHDHDPRGKFRNAFLDTYIFNNCGVTT